MKQLILIKAGLCLTDRHPIISRIWIRNNMKNTGNRVFSLDEIHTSLLLICTGDHSSLTCKRLSNTTTIRVFVSRRSELKYVCCVFINQINTGTPLEAGQGISTESYGWDDVPPDELGSGLYTQFIIFYIPCILALFWLIEIGSFLEIFTNKESVWAWWYVGWYDAVI